MADIPPLAEDGYCSNRVPVRGSLRKRTSNDLGKWTPRTANRYTAACPCGQSALRVNVDGILIRHQPPPPDGAR